MSIKEETKTQRLKQKLSTEDEKQEEKEEQASNTSEGKNISHYSSSDCDNVEDDLEDAKKYGLAHL